jgi:hypothetical protein
MTTRIPILPYTRTIAWLASLVTQLHSSYSHHNLILLFTPRVVCVTHTHNSFRYPHHTAWLVILSHHSLISLITQRVERHTHTKADSVTHTKAWHVLLGDHNLTLNNSHHTTWLAFKEQLYSLTPLLTPQMTRVTHTHTVLAILTHRAWLALLAPQSNSVTDNTHADSHHNITPFTRTTSLTPKPTTQLITHTTADELSWPNNQIKLRTQVAPDSATRTTFDSRYSYHIWLALLAPQLTSIGLTLAWLTPLTPQPNSRYSNHSLTPLLQPLHAMILTPQPESFTHTTV